jgi:hypothetical protein
MYVLRTRRRLDRLLRAEAVTTHTQHALVQEAHTTLLPVDVLHRTVAHAPAATGAALIGEEALKGQDFQRLSKEPLRNAEHPTQNAYPLDMRLAAVNPLRDPLGLARSPLQPGTHLLR